MHLIINICTGSQATGRKHCFFLSPSDIFKLLATVSDQQYELQKTCLSDLYSRISGVKYQLLLFLLLLLLLLSSAEAAVIVVVNYYYSLYVFTELLYSIILSLI